MKKQSLLISILFLLTIFLVACSEENTSPQATNVKESSTNKLKIYTTIFPLEDFTKKIGGDLVEVESILPTGADAHTYEPTTKTMVNIAESDGFISSGVGIESFSEKIEQSLKKEDVLFINAGVGLEQPEENHVDHEEEEEHHDDHDHDHGDLDPHVWLDPILSITLAENIKDALVKLNPEGEKTFEENLQQVKGQLVELDKSFTDIVNHSDKKELLVSHAAYGYWENRYGIEQISVLGLSPTEEPSQKELQTIIETAKEHNLTYIIFETNVSSNVTDIVQAAIGAESLTLSNLETITEEDQKNNEDYFSIMKKNLETLEKALSNK